MKLREIHDQDISFEELKSLRPVFAKLAQEVYDEWDEEDEDTYAGGGICHLMADKFCEYLQSKGIDCGSVSAQVGEQHVFTVVKTSDGVAEVDINPYTYERGGGYSWQKIPDVELQPSDVAVNILSRNPEDFEQYIEEF